MEYTEVLDKQITRKQHYVPKAYLKNFSVSNQKSEQVYVVFANDENAKMVSIDNICCRSYLYDQIAIDPDSKTHILQHQMRSRTVLSNWKANTQQLSQR